MRKAIAALLLVGYGLTLFYLTLVMHTTPRLLPRNRVNLVLARTITTFHHKGGREMVINNVGNLAAFLPLGLLLPLLRDRRTTAWQVGLSAAGISLAIEILQYVSGRRVADVDDVLLNTLGGLLGYVLYRAIEELLRRAGALVGNPPV